MLSERSPEVLHVLHPLEEADHDGAAVGAQVRQHRDASIAQDGVAAGRQARVAGLHNHLDAAAGTMSAVMTYIDIFRSEY